MFTIDLNLEPRERFKEVSVFYKEGILEAFSKYQNLID